MAKRKRSRRKKSRTAYVKVCRWVKRKAKVGKKRKSRKSSRRKKR